MKRFIMAALVSGAIIILVGLIIDGEIHTRFAIISAIVGGCAMAVLDRDTRR